MCVCQYRDYVNCSYFKRDENGSYGKDLMDGNLEIRINSYKYYKNLNGQTYNSIYYVTDIKRVKKLAKIGNKYALNHRRD